MAHVNRQSVCSVEPALWADSWQRVSAGVVRRAACRSEIPSMFAVRMRVSRSRRELSSTCIEPSDERMGSVAGRTARSLRSPRAAFGESNREPRRRSDEACVRSLTQGCRSPSRKSNVVGVEPTLLEQRTSLAGKVGSPYRGHFSASPATKERSLKLASTATDS